MECRLPAVLPNDCTSRFAKSSISGARWSHERGSKSTESRIGRRRRALLKFLSFTLGRCRFVFQILTDFICRRPDRRDGLPQLLLGTAKLSAPVLDLRRLVDIDPA